MKCFVCNKINTRNDKTCSKECAVIYNSTERLEDKLNIHWLEAPLTDDDREYIKDGVCFNCWQECGVLSNIDYVRLISGGFMWWHKQCPILRKN